MTEVFGPDTYLTSEPTETSIPALPKMLAKQKFDLPQLPRSIARGIAIVALFGMTLGGIDRVEAQRTRFNDAFQVIPGNAQGGIVAPPSAGFTIPQGGIVAPQPFVQPGAVFGGNILPSTQPPITILPPSQIIQAPNPIFGGPAQPAFDPFQTPNTPLPGFPGAAPILPQANPQFLPQNNQPFFGRPAPTQPRGGFFALPNPQPFTPSQPSNIAPFNAGSGDWSLANRWPNANTAWPSQAWARLRGDVLPRLLERPRFRHTWLQGGTNSELDINDTELATTITFANWLGTSQALRLSPGFIFHFWDGPNTPETGFDLPSRAYSVYLSGDYASDPRAPAGFETNLTVGLYSDFRNTSSDGIRLTGTGLLWKRINSYTTFKFGAEYLDRVDVKLLPAIGVFLAPNPDLRLDVYFPRPKLAQRLPRIGRFEVWSYIGAEYGGGSWAIERTPLVGDNFDDQADINDVRAFVGLEWMGPKRATGFLELGYAFERELLYRSDPQNPLEINDTFMLRTGMAF